VDVLDRLVRRSGFVTDLGLAVALASLLALEAAYLAPDTRGWPFDLVVGVLIGVTTLLRRRNRLWAAAVGIAVCAAAVVVAAVGQLPRQPGAAATVALLVLGGAAVRVAPVVPAASIAVTGAAVFVAGRLTVSPQDPTNSAVIGLFEWTCALGVGLWLRYQDVRGRAVVEAVRRDERLAMARELHDLVAHHVTGMVVQAQAARLVAAKRPETLEPALAGIEGAGTEALAAMHSLVGLLRDPEDAAATTGGSVALSGFAGVAAEDRLRDLIARFADHGPAVTLALPGDGSPQRWPAEVANTVYRVVQEALTNIVRHAPDAHAVSVTVRHDPRSVTVEVTDDAPGAGARPTRKGYGLIGMRERVEALGGYLRVGPHEKAGWLVQASVPLPARADA